MKVYLHSDAAEEAARYVVTIAPAGDTDFVSGAIPDSWKHADGRPKQIEIVFAFGAADVSDENGRYMVARGIAHSNRMLRKVRQLFDRFGKPLEEVFDETGKRIFLKGQTA
jgi:hypothetical protein